MLRMLKKILHVAAVTLAALLPACAEDGTRAPPLTSLTLEGPAEHLASVAVLEPMVAEHPQGALFVAGFTKAIEESGQPPKLFMSVDAGATWEAVYVGTAPEGAVGNSDVDLAIAPDGTVYFLTMGFDRAKGEGTHVAVGVSRDIGKTWAWTYLSQDRFDDRPWIEVAPDGVVHVVWNDGQGVSHALSTDAGQTWGEQERIHPQGGSSHLVVGPGGEIAVRITPRSASGNRYDEGVDLIAVSVDGGITWEKRRPPGNRAWGSDSSESDLLPRWVEPMAWDAEGTLYHLWSEGSVLWLGRSADQGETWEAWAIVTGEEPLYYPYLAARGAGELAATWFSSFGDNLRAHVAIIDASGASRPLVRSGDPFLVDSWRQTGESLTRVPGGEYLAALFLSDGDLCVVAPIDNSLDDRRGFSLYRTSNEPD
ncbi:sialidase family protein [Gemmatimonadota bacterium]